MSMVLLSKNKLQFVDGNIAVLAVISWIIHSVSPQIAQSIIWIDSALEIWTDLRSRFAQSNFLRDELMISRPLLACSSVVQCSCNLYKRIREYYEADHVLDIPKWQTIGIARKVHDLYKITATPISNLAEASSYSSNSISVPLSVNAVTVFATLLDQEKEPRNYKEAAQSENWTKAMQSEIEALECNNTWSVVDLPHRKTAIGCKWVLKVKRKADGSIEMYKARLVAKGYTQQEGVDFMDHTLFTNTTGDCFMALLVYVDDVVLPCNNMEEIVRVKSYLHETFSIKDLGELKYFLGLEVARSSKGINLCQKKYIMDLLRDADFLEIKPCPTPILPETRLSKDQGTPLADIRQYRQIVGKLQYLTATRPDLSFMAQQLAQFLDKPTDLHMNVIHRVLRYLKGTIGHGLFLPADKNLKIQAFSDSEWVTCIDTRRSKIGYCVLLGKALVSWKSKKQNTISHSST
ncbi:Reverse transcriptase, RNA-dependent DNA polymerase [Corchorus capsularis]|uniref:Reverse transcriptase, RNA-dependent DNA polymerase n=1 Tax=Corchorus capsularis TaxID=210143 RepID=A0A1R3FZE3_COCAP|nr:Reverse transcriptase, RNA-dependent DNA polymerase [Corchorus capsularis]